MIRKKITISDIRKARKALEDFYALHCLDHRVILNQKTALFFIGKQGIQESN